jgi:hypothetical protein
MLGLYKTTAYRTGALTATNILFIVEFRFDYSRFLRIVALCLFALSTPLMVPVVLAASWYSIGERFKTATRPLHFGPITNFAFLMSIIAIGIVLYTMHWSAALFYACGIGYTLYFPSRLLFI